MSGFTAHPTAEISSESGIGRGTKIWHHAQIRERVEIGKNCVIGKNVYVDVGVRIGDGVKIQNNVSIYQGVTIENLAFIGPAVVFTNDLYARSFSEKWDVVPTLIREGASLGANSTIVCGVTIGRYATVAAGTVVTSDVEDHVLVMGVPGRPTGFVCRCGRRLTRNKLKDQADVYRCDACRLTWRFGERPCTSTPDA